LKTTINITVLLLLLFTATNSMAQSNLLNSTLDSARNLRNNGHFDEAVKTLEAFNAQHPDNTWLLQLYAETLFWLKDYEKADSVYRRAIEVYPNNFELKYEYALFLFDRGNYEETRSLLTLYVENRPDNPGAESMLGIANYYLGNFKDAENHLNKSLALNPSDQKTKQVYSEVSHVVKPWIKGSVLYTDDSQPMSQWKPSVAGGWYQSHFINLSFAADFRNFSEDSTHSSMAGFTILNHFAFPKAGFNAAVSAGGFYTFINKAVDFTWSIQLDKTFLKNLHLKAGGEHSPYTYTIASIRNPFLRNRFNFSLSWETTQSWNADLGYIGEYFPDDNSVQTTYFWFLSPSMKFSVFSANIGYAFNYADAKESRYVSEQSLQEIVEDYQPDKKITGVYNPYFTPNNQFSNSVLANVYIHPSLSTSIKLHASVGVYARAMNPYLYLGKKNGNTIIKEEFYQEKFTPLDLGINFNADLSESIMLNFSYQYLQTFYYNSNNFEAGLKIYF
jgi:tetratricopeptide (TPR) repeat protein